MIKNGLRVGPLQRPSGLGVGREKSGASQTTEAPKVPRGKKKRTRDGPTTKAHHSQKQQQYDLEDRPLILVWSRGGRPAHLET
jgi:hypothetical protein